ncbi:Metallo-dependent phosphatase [Xylariomycetidae sp. FL2044]|nr:Metallo-dependent phosphatase [Xylariomycetidae sp. FL2044]
MLSRTVVLLTLSFTPVWHASAKRFVNASGPFGPLRLRPDGSFQISIFEDLHFGENAWDSWGPQQDINSVRVINSILDNESPDLVVLNGDLITGGNTFAENSTRYVDQIVAPLVDRGLTWASTYGNHDYDFNISGGAIMAREHRWPNSRTRQMVSHPDAGASNYYLPVYANDCDEEAGCDPELVLWFFDSRGGFRHQERNATTGAMVGQPNWVDPHVVAWFERTSRQLARAHHHRTRPAIIPALAFVHIPTFASLAHQRRSGVDAHREPGINDDDPLAPQSGGWCPDGRDDGTCVYGGQDAPFMRALADTPGLMAVFSGHDHGDSWCYRWDRRLPDVMSFGPTAPAPAPAPAPPPPLQRRGIDLCFGQHSGYGGYGNWERGSRQVRVTRAGLARSDVDSWVRLESGSVVGSVSLNATYGLDRYPQTKNTMTSCPTCVYSRGEEGEAMVRMRQSRVDYQFRINFQQQHSLDVGRPRMSPARDEL